MFLVEMPKANENLTEATLDHWLVKEGDAIKADQGLCEIITDKAKFDMPAPGAGVLLKRLAPDRSLLPVGYVMCVIGNAGETIPADLDEKNQKLLAEHKAAATSVTSSGTSAAPSTAGGPVAGAGVRATPVARRLAKEAGVDLAEIVKALNLTGPVNEKDVKAFLEGKK
jgi:pyruvate/2-oxoglutarate dehydrogenase complex dihydrolipoamide acyltransferase (E2) component